MKIKLALATLVATLVLGGVCYAQTEADARKIIEASKDAVVTVDIVIEAKMTYNGKTEKQEDKHTTTATVIDSSGLVVTSLTQVSPDAGNDPQDKADGYSYSIDTKDVRIRTADGTEIPADIVLRDQDLDLAFIKPKTKPEKPMAFIDLAASGAAQVLDQIVVVSRLGQAANRSTAARLDRVESVVTKPRTFYIVNSSLHDELGVPAFTMDGKCIGVLVLRYMSGSHSDDSDYYASVIPCSTIANAAQQAKDAKGPAKPVAAPAK